MNLQAIERFLSKPTEANLDRFLDSPDVVFWVDWREEDDAIVQYCEDILQTEQLGAELRDIEEEPGFQLVITYKDQSLDVSLLADLADRHITLVALNQAIGADFEVRFCIASAGGDTLAFVPLPNEVWRQLEEKYPNVVAEHFAKIEERPNLFTKGYGASIQPSWEALARDPSQKLAAIKAYRDLKSCGLAEAKAAVESFIAGLG